MEYKTDTKLKELEEKRIARAKAENLPISFKKSVELARFLRYKPLKKVYKLLEGIINKKIPVPYLRYNRDVPHKKGIGAGRYPVKPAKYFLQVLKNAEANANNKGLNSDDLIVIHLSVDKGVTRYKYGRHRGRRAKSTHVQVILYEQSSKKSKKKESKKQENEKDEEQKLNQEKESKEENKKQAKGE